MKYKIINKSKCYCITLNRAGNALMDFYDDVLSEAGITTKQYSLLIRLNRLGQANVVELAEYVNLERSTVTRNLKTLISNGWVYDRAEKNKRNHQYALTQKGKEQIQKTAQYWDKCQKEILDMIGEEKVHIFMEVLYKIQDLQKTKNETG